MTRRALETAVTLAMDAAASRPMAWGADDCALWVANALREPLGYDPAAKVRGRYRTRRGAARVAGRLGLLGQLRSIARRHEWQRISPELAQPGDVGMAWTVYQGKPVLATVMCRSRGWFVGRAEFGFAAVRANKVAVTWSVLCDALSTSARRVNLSRLQMGSNLRSVQATQDPISVALLTYVGIEATATAVALTTTALSVGLSIGVSLVSSLLQPHTGSTLSNGSVSAATAQGAQITERQSIPYKRIIVGRAYVGGALFYEHVSPPYLTMGVLINHGKIDGIEAVYVGTDQLQFPQLIQNSILTPSPVAGQPDYPNRLKVSLRYGADDQVTDLLILSGTSPIGPSVGTPIGDMNLNGGIAAAFDGVTSKSYGASASVFNGGGPTTGHLGKDWGLGVTKTISYFAFWIPNDDGGVLAKDGGSVQLEGSSDNTNWTILRSTGVSPMRSTSLAVHDGINTSTAYRYHRVTLSSSSGAMYVAQVAFYELLTAQSSFDQFRQRGIATAVYRYDYGADQIAFTRVWGQVQRPTAYVIARGVVIYDPRDPTQSLADETTWKWTNNATLVQAWYLTRSYGGRIPKARIRWDRIATSADYDDSLMGCNDGTMIKKHTIDGVITLNQQPSTVMQELLKSNRAMVLESGGQVWIQSSYPKASVATIHDRILAGGLTYQADKLKTDKTNKLQVRFVAPDQNYQVVDGPVLSRLDLQSSDQEVLPATLGLNYTTDHRRAQRLQKCFLANSRLGKTITCTVDLRLMAVAADELVGSVVTVNSVLFSSANGDYMVTAVGFADDCTTLSLALTQYDPTIETAWNSGTDEQAFVLAPV